jgi:hypothetical protein
MILTKQLIGMIFRLQFPDEEQLSILGWTKEDLEGKWRRKLIGREITKEQFKSLKRKKVFKPQETITLTQAHLEEAVRRLKGKPFTDRQLKAIGMTATQTRRIVGMEITRRNLKRFLDPRSFEEIHQTIDELPF